MFESFIKRGVDQFSLRKLQMITGNILLQANCITKRLNLKLNYCLFLIICHPFYTVKGLKIYFTQ